MVRETSITCYKEIKESGLLSRVRFEVYGALVAATEMGEKVSSAELFYRMKGGGRNPSHSNVATRLGELRDMGVAQECGEKVCNITGRTVIAWEAKDALPKALKRESKRLVFWAQVDLFGEIMHTSKKPWPGWIKFVESR